MYLIGVREYYNQIRKAIQYCMNITSSFSFLIFTTIFNAEGEIQPSRLLAPHAPSWTFLQWREASKRRLYSKVDDCVDEII